MDILELRRKRGKILEDMQAFLDARSDMTAEDEATYDKMEADVMALDGNIERLERQMAREAETAKPLPRWEDTLKSTAPTSEKSGSAGTPYKFPPD